MRTHENTDETPSMSTPIRKNFTRSFIGDFLAQGVFLDLGQGLVFVGWGNVSLTANPGPASLFAPDFYMRTSRPWVRPEFWDLISKDALQASLPPSTSEIPLEWQLPKLEEFSEPFYFLQKEMALGRLQKAVPVVRATARAHFSEVRRSAALQRLLQAPSALRAYGFWTHDEGLLGATPESLFTLRNENLQTMALAGTRAESAQAADIEAFLEDPKERHEHQLVVQDLRARLQKWGQVECEALRVLHLPGLMHLQTPVSVQMRNAADWLQLVKELHPTPALGFAPRTLGLDWMQGWDRCARSRYGAPLALQIPGEPRVECWVAIRNIQWQGDVISLVTGCGVVPESRLEKEWAELDLKRQSVRRLLGI